MYIATIGVALSIHKVVKKSTSYYILTGASGMSVLCAILMTFSTALKVNSAKKVKKEKWLAEAEQRRQSSLDLKEIEVSNWCTCSGVQWFLAGYFSQM